MAKLTLQGCKHPIIKTWGDHVTFGDSDITVTCMVCYERLIIPNEMVNNYTRVGARTKDNSNLPHAVPAPMCRHAEKDIIEKDQKYKAGNFTDALCKDCGVVLRHPEGPGGWHEVLFNGYVIREEP